MTLTVGTLQTDITGNTTGLEAAEKKAKQLYNKIQNSADAATDSTLDLSKANSTVGNSSGAASRGVGQLGIQMGQFAGQIQGGQSALLAFSQQSADILFVLGQMFPFLAGIGGIAGGIIAVGSALAGSLLPQLFKSTDAVGNLEKATESLGKVAKTVGEGDLVVLTDEIAKLAEKSEDAAKAMVRGGISDAMGVIEASAAGAKAQVKELADEILLSEKASSGRKGQEYARRLQRTAKDLGLNVTEAKELAGAIRQVNEQGDDASLQRLQKTLDQFASESSNKKMIQLANSVRQFSDESGKANAKLVSLRDIVDDVSRAAEQSKTIGGADVDSAIADIEKLGETEREAISREFAEREALILANTQLTGDKQTELLAKIAADRDQKLAAITDKEAAANQKMLDAKQRQIDQILALDESETDRAMRLFMQRKEWIMAQTQLSEDELTALMIAARSRRDADLQKIRDREVAAEERKNQQIQAAFNQQMTAMNAMTSAMGQIVSAAGEEGAQRMASIINGVAQAAAQIATLMQAQATAQAAADPTAITLPQKIANVASMGSLFAGIISTIAGAKKGGGRQFGGTTSGNMMHRVNEGGVPELLSVGGQQYLMPLGKNGNVTPMDKSTESQGQPKVTIINNATGVEVSADYVSREDLRVYVDSKISQVNKSLASGRGDTAKSMQQGFNVQRKLR